MAMENSEKAGLGVAVVAHIALFTLLSYQIGSPDPLKFENPPMAVEIFAESAPVATAPQLSTAPPAARLGDPDARDQPVLAPPEPPKPVAREVVRAAPPQRRVEPQRPPPPRQATPPTRNPPAQRTPPVVPARNRDPSGALDGAVDAVARDAQRNARSTAPPAVQTAAAIRADIRVSINSEVRSPWNSCRVSGIDVDQLKTTIVFRLTQAGGLERITSVNTSGVNDSNRPQLQRFEECARRAIQLAAPFANLPPEHFSYWQTYTLDFEKR